MKVKCKKILTNRPDRKDRGNQTENLAIGKEYIVLCVKDSIENVHLTVSAKKSHADF